MYQRKDDAVSYYRIDLRQIPRRYQHESLLRVIPSSPLALKQEVEKLAYYFRREFHYDFVQFEASETGPFDAYLFSSLSDFPPVWAGACCFRTRHFDDLDAEIQGFQWMWLHPYFRGRGILSSQWKTLRTNHGDFYPEPPVSPAMKEFLLRRNKDSIWYPLFEGEQLDVAAIKTKLKTEKK